MKRFAVSAIVSSAEEALFSSSSSRRRRPPSTACYSVGYFVGVLFIFGGLFLMASVLETVQSTTSSPLTNNNLRVAGSASASGTTQPPQQQHDVKGTPGAQTAVAAVSTITAVPEATAARPGTPPMETIQKLYEVGRKDPLALIKTLEQGDPLGVNLADPHAFQCPPDPSQRLDHPSLVNVQSLEAFRGGAEGSFIFYQHLRKAGGTGFCDLAKRNLPVGSVPAYYCMPDQRGSLALQPWGDPVYLARHMRERGFKIAANEWDVYHTDHGDIPNVVLATTMRHPVDRWYSQYRFEHLEHRDGSNGTAPRQTFRQFYDADKGWTMGVNYYIKTFIGDPDPKQPRNKGDFYWTYHKYQKAPVTWAQFAASLQNLRKYHVLLITEWLDSSPPLLQAALGWTSPPKQVLPHEVQAVRAEKKSVAAKDAVPPADYQHLLKENALDVLYFHAAKRIYLERLTCSTR